VAVSSTPGKTKHFQTINVNNQLMLCDCPGLVFPSFMNSTGEMICAGILPINQMRDHLEPSSIIASRVPMYLLDAIYGIHIKKVLDLKDDANRPPTAAEFLGAYAELKGYITGTGRWDEFRASKDVLRDFNDGRILYANPPPASEIDPPIDMERWMADSEYIMAKRERVAERLALQRLRDLESDTVVGKSDEKDSSDINQTVFGDGQVYDDDSDDSNSLENESVVQPSETATVKREHKRLKHWGKKGKKLRDKTPYAEENGTVSYVAYSTNRTIGTFAKLDKVTRNNPTKAYGSPFVRQTLPYQPQTQALPRDNRRTLIESI